jgi:hypothetical protein
LPPACSGEAWHAGAGPSAGGLDACRIPEAPRLTRISRQMRSAPREHAVRRPGARPQSLAGRVSLVGPWLARTETGASLHQVTARRSIETRSADLAPMSASQHRRPCGTRTAVLSCQLLPVLAGTPGGRKGCSPADLPAPAAAGVDSRRAGQAIRLARPAKREEAAVTDRMTAPAADQRPGRPGQLPRAAGQRPRVGRRAGSRRSRQCTAAPAAPEGRGSLSARARQLAATTAARGHYARAPRLAQVKDVKYRQGALVVVRAAARAGAWRSRVSPGGSGSRPCTLRPCICGLRSCRDGCRRRCSVLFSRPC